MSQLLQNAVYGTAMILAVAALRRVLKDRLAPGARLALWAVCLFRLFTPAAPASVLSLWGLGRWFGQKAQTVNLPGPAVPASNGSGTFVPAAPGAMAPAAHAPVKTGIPWEAVLLGIWLAVGLALAVRYALSYVRTRRAVGCAIPVGRDDPRYAALPRCARLREGPVDGAPLTFGAARPTVVLSPGLSGQVLECVLAHEGVHAKRRDNLWHYAMAAALTAFWWNPAVWLMARLLRRDVELSCDRAVLEKLGAGRRADYANALVSMATQAEGPAFCQTFGRKAAEERIVSIMKYKKTTIAGAAVTLALVLAVTVAFASNPAQPDTVEYHGQTYNRADLSQETLDWLDWYCSLSEEGQMSVSMVPPELIPEGDVTAYDVNACGVAGCDVSGEHHHENGEVVHHYNTLPAELPVCPVEGCTISGEHHHEDDTAGHHSAEPVFCGIEGCTIPGEHFHHDVETEDSATAPSGDDPICELPLAKDSAEGADPWPVCGYPTAEDFANNTHHSENHHSESHHGNGHH